MQLDADEALAPGGSALFPLFGAEISALCRVKCQGAGERFGTIPELVIADRPGRADVGEVGWGHGTSGSDSCPIRPVSNIGPDVVDHITVPMLLTGLVVRASETAKPKSLGDDQEIIIHRAGLEHLRSDLSP